MQLVGMMKTLRVLRADSPGVDRHSFVKSLLPMLVVTVVLMVIGPTVAAHAENGDKAKLDELRATDAELVRGVAALDKDIARQQAEVDAANQAIEAANVSVGAAEGRIADLQKRLDVVRALAAERAVSEYMQPSEGILTQLLISKGFDDAQRRTELLRDLNNSNFNAIDEMRAIERDLNRERQIAANSRQVAQERRDTAQRDLDELKKTRDEKVRLETELKARIAAAAEEDSVVRKPEAGTENMTLSASGLIWPVKGKPIVTSPYGMRWGRMHEGIDVGASVGTPLYAVKSGTVTWASVESGYGNYLCVSHGGGFQTCNGHLSRFAVTKGQQVEQGQLIGYSGNTGASRGPHLHFETCASNGPSCVYGTTKNPMNYLSKP